MPSFRSVGASIDLAYLTNASNISSTEIGSNPSTKFLVERLAAVLVTAIIAPVLLVLVLLCLVLQGRPIFVRLERMNGPNSTFKLLKFRTLPVEDGKPVGVANRERLGRTTAFARFLRRSRLDEFPQIINVVSGNIGFVGPRPPEPCHVRAQPNLFRPVLQSRPGITGLGTVIFSAYERRIIGRLGAEAAEAIYADRILPRKLALERIFIRKRNPAVVVYVLYLTFAQMLPLPGRRAHRLRRLGRVSLKAKTDAVAIADVSDCRANHAAEFPQFLMNASFGNCSPMNLNPDQMAPAGFCPECIPELCTGHAESQTDYLRKRSLDC